MLTMTMTMTMTRYYVNNRFLLAIGLNVSFIILELFYGFRANSVALIADAVHNAGDVFGLALIWFSYYMAERKAPHKFTYGYKNGTIFAAFLNTIVLFIAVGNLIWISIERFTEVEYVVSSTMMMVAAAGVVINGLTAILFIKDRHKDINTLGIFLNMSIDAALSLCVVLAGFFIWWKGWYWVDPTVGLVIAASVIVSFWGIFKESINLIFQAVPASINLHEIKKDLSACKAIVSYHDLHVWPLSTTETALTVHIITKKHEYDPELVYKLSDQFSKDYGIHHATIQLEIEGSDLPCSLAVS